MAKSIGSPGPVPAARVVDRQSDSVLQAEWRSGRLIHRLTEDGLTATYEMRYQIGAGIVGHSYAALAGDSLLQSPASYYKHFGWDISPGYSGSELLDFNRVLTSRCLFCHSNFLDSHRDGKLDVQNLTAIGCQRCHGDTNAHLQHPSAATIVNPAKLTPRARDSICEQCHLEGAARILNPGKKLNDFKPGTDLEETVAIYVVKQTGSGTKAVSQEEQLATSRCLRESGGKLWCGTCHNPHSEVHNRAAELKSICGSCHAGKLPATHAAYSECTTCHMPQRPPSDVAHTALTDHRILVRPASAQPITPTDTDLKAWREPAGADPTMEQRNRALAYLSAAEDSAYRALGARGEHLLDSLPQFLRDTDGAVAAASGAVALSHNQPADALAFFERASALNPTDADYALYAGIARKQAGDNAGAALEWTKAIELNRGLQRAYLELSRSYAAHGKNSEARKVLDDYLHWNGQSILVQLTKETLPAN